MASGLDLIFQPFRQAHVNGIGYELADTLKPLASSSQPNRLRMIARSTNHAAVEGDVKNQIFLRQAGYQLPRAEGNAWTDVYVAYWKAIERLVIAEEASRQNGQANWSSVYESWKDMTNALHRGYTNGGFKAWTVPCLYVAGKFLRIFAIKADEELESSSSSNFEGGFQEEENPEAGKNVKLEDAARTLNRLFQLCIADRAPLESSRKWGIYNIVNLLFKTYFKLNSISLSKNILKALQATTIDMPELSQFPKSHQVTYKYYVGVIQFLEENYVLAEQLLTEAWQLCHRKATRNKELILTYLIPCHLLTTHTLPSQALLEPFPRLQKLFSPLALCIKRGDLSGFDAALIAGEDEFVKRRIYLTLERGRDIALRNLLRKVFIVGGFEEAKDGSGPVRKTRITVTEFGAAISIGSKERMDNDEVECLIANMIYKNLMKGYISRSHGIVVLSKGGAFPGTGV